MSSDVHWLNKQHNIFLLDVLLILPFLVKPLVIFLLWLCCQKISLSYLMFMREKTFAPWPTTSAYHDHKEVHCLLSLAKREIFWVRESYPEEAIQWGVCVECADISVCAQGDDQSVCVAASEQCSLSHFQVWPKMLFSLSRSTQADSAATAVGIVHPLLLISLPAGYTDWQTKLKISHGKSFIMLEITHCLAGCGQTDQQSKQCHALSLCGISLLWYFPDWNSLLMG